MNQINANAPTPDEIMELVRENERLKGVIEAIESSRQKFAIEQQVKGITRILACRELNLSEGDVDTIILMKDQIRKD